MEAKLQTTIPGDLAQAIQDSPVLSQVLKRWSEIELPECWLVAGSIAQTYWNRCHNFNPCYGVRDIDIVYFDSGDLTQASEITQATRVEALFEDLPVGLDVKNEARVHLWYEQKFGYSLKPYTSTIAAIDTFPTTATTIGVRPNGGDLEAYATYGYEDLLAMVVRANKIQITEQTYHTKVGRWQELWPLLRIVNWNDV